jgi:hypothetical protein
MWWVVIATLLPLYPRERLGNHCKGGWVCPRARLDGCGKSRSPPVFDFRTIQPVARCYTDWSIPAHKPWIKKAKVWIFQNVTMFQTSTTLCFKKYYFPHSGGKTLQAFYELYFKTSGNLYTRTQFNIQREFFFATEFSEGNFSQWNRWLQLC